MIDKHTETLTEVLTLNPGSEVAFWYDSGQNDYVATFTEYGNTAATVIATGGSLFIAIANLAAMCRSELAGVLI